MYPVAPQHERKTRKDYGTKRGRHSTSASSSSAFGHPSSFHHVDGDNNEDDEGTCRVSTPFPTCYVNYLSNDIPQVFSNPPHDDQTMANLFTRLMRLSLDFNKKFYNSLGSAPNHCSVVKTRLGGCYRSLGE
ncbi:hypothetical protein Tco_0714074 [Tanacetum coccineum]